MNRTTATICIAFSALAFLVATSSVLASFLPGATAAALVTVAVAALAAAAAGLAGVAIHPLTRGAAIGASVGFVIVAGILVSVAIVNLQDLIGGGFNSIGGSLLLMGCAPLGLAATGLTSVLAFFSARERSRPPAHHLVDEGGERPLSAR